MSSDRRTAHAPTIVGVTASVLARWLSAQQGFAGAALALAAAHLAYMAGDSQSATDKLNEAQRLGRDALLALCNGGQTDGD